jgi:osmotically-inducible protein OsmY
MFRKAVLSIVTIVLLTGAMACSSWNRATPKQWDNAAIEAEIRKNLAADGMTGMTVQSDNGRVTLKGDVNSAGDRSKAIEDAKKVEGVSRVIADITIH